MKIKLDGYDYDESLQILREGVRYNLGVAVAFAQDFSFVKDSIVYMKEQVEHLMDDSKGELVTNETVKEKDRIVLRTLHTILDIMALDVLDEDTEEYMYVYSNFVRNWASARGLKDIERRSMVVDTFIRLRGTTEGLILEMKSLVRSNQRLGRYREMDNTMSREYIYQIQDKITKEIKEGESDESKTN